ncbi:hypothetical protein BDR07DRAFT_1388412 [Suillus spraguei]|nr:hypothetical protein BDR07DRAFT_1388412 [Suillus spraguei]
MTIEYTIGLVPSPPTLMKDKIICLWDRGDGVRCRDRSWVPGADSTTLTCWWDGCAQHMEKCAIVKHIQDIHLGVTYPCRRCGVTFAGKRSFELHLLGCPVPKKRIEVELFERTLVFERSHELLGCLR